METMATRRPCEGALAATIAGTATAYVGLAASGVILIHRPTGPCPQVAARSHGPGTSDYIGSNDVFPYCMFQAQHIHFYNTPVVGIMGGVGGMGQMWGRGGHAGAGPAVASAGRGQGPTGNNYRVGKQHHGRGRHERVRNSAREDILQQLVAGGILRRNDDGTFVPINAPAAPGAINPGTGNNVGGRDANTGANNQGTGATGGNLL